MESTATTNAPSDTSRAARRLPLAVTIAAIGAVLVNLALLAVGNAAGADMIAAPAGEPQPVGIPAVIGATLVAFAVGSLLLWLITRRRPAARRTFGWLGLAVGVLSSAAPLALSVDLATGITLAAMHVASGAWWFFAVARGH